MIIRGYRAFKEQVLETIQNAGFIGNYLYFLPIDHVLCGFCANSTPRGIYISSYRYPLFNRSESLDLLFSERLPYPEGFLRFREVQKKDRAREFVRRIEPYVEEMRGGSSLQAFSDYINDHKDVLRNEWAKKTYVLFLVLTEDYSAAWDYLDIALQSGRAPGRETIRMECEMIRNALEKDPESARQLVLKWESEMKIYLGLMHTNGSLESR